MTNIKNVSPFLETSNSKILETENKQYRSKLNFEMAFSTPISQKNKTTVPNRKIAVTPKQIQELCPELEKQVVQNIISKYGSAGAKLPKDIKCVFGNFKEDDNAFVDPKKPNEIKVNIRGTPWLNKSSISDLKNMLTHETLHSASVAFVESVRDDLAGKQELVQMNQLYSTKSIILAEGFAEYFTEKLNGKASNTDNEYYVAYLKLAKTICAEVGEETVKKAFFTNDPIARRRVIKSLEKFEVKY
jgi:hypothetical protein